MSASDDNPLLIPAPPPGIAPQPKKTETEDVVAADPDSFINLPPGIVDSGTYRLSSPKPVPKTTQGVDDGVPAFFPVSAPGLPPAPIVAPVPSSTAPETAPGPVIELDGVDDATMVSTGRASSAVWRLGLPDSRRVLLHTTTLIGRDPAQSAAWPNAELLAVVDRGKTVSKTHAVIEVTATGQLVVHDLDSTNGVFLSYPSGEDFVVEPGEPALVEHGAQLSFGEFTVTVERT